MCSDRYPRHRYQKFYSLNTQAIEGIEVSIVIAADAHKMEQRPMLGNLLECGIRWNALGNRIRNELRN